VWGCEYHAQPPTWRARPPYLWPPETGWPSYTPRHWVPILVVFYDTHELRWDCSYPPVTTRIYRNRYNLQDVDRVELWSRVGCSSCSVPALEGGEWSVSFLGTRSQNQLDLICVRIVGHLEKFLFLPVISNPCPSARSHSVKLSRHRVGKMPILVCGPGIFHFHHPSLLFCYEA
jgi:hypothetical protein